MMKKAMLAMLVPAVLFIGGCDDSSKEKADLAVKQSNEHSAATQPNAEKGQATDDVDKALKEIEERSTPEKIEQFNKLPDNDSSNLREIVVTEMKKKLPLLIDEATLMSDVSLDGNTFSYKYVIKGIPANVIEGDQWKNNMQKSIVNRYCSNNAQVTMFRDLFTEGVIYNYYVSEKLVYTYKAVPSVCNQ